MGRTFKKRFIELPDVERFMQEQTQSIIDEYILIREELQIKGMLSMPKAEKLRGKNLFAMRILQAGNVRVFYAYGINNIIWGLHAYTKKTMQIPKHELKHAVKILNALTQKGLIP